MKTYITLTIVALAALISTGYTRSLIRRLRLALRQDEPDYAAWWIQEIHYVEEEGVRARLGRAIALSCF